MQLASREKDADFSAIHQLSQTADWVGFLTESPLSTWVDAIPKGVLERITSSNTTVEKNVHSEELTFTNPFSEANEPILQFSTSDNYPDVEKTYRVPKARRAQSCIAYKAPARKQSPLYDTEDYVFPPLINSSPNFYVSSPHDHFVPTSSDTPISYKFVVETPNTYEVHSSQLIPASINDRRHSIAVESPAAFICPWHGCGKYFSRFYNLRSHFRIHSGERPFICTHCDASFARNHDLKRHARIHTNVKPFVCQNCQKSFSRNDAMTRHLRLNSCSRRSLSSSLPNTSVTPEF